MCRRFKAKDVVAVLQELTSLDPAPAYIRSENSTEFIAQALRDWCEASDRTITVYIEPGSTWENGVAESFIGRFRDEFLNTELFTTAPEAQLLADRWRWTNEGLTSVFWRPSPVCAGAHRCGPTAVLR
ncbi:integrase core domain-containing protein [Synechococcus sp. CBW1006]|uniref:integrase core domain-containing protein n=1 Tax=Synechococcus sp. CBW1006 TaxID=1353138 RepID=UPI0018CCFF6F|nr:integrase core domain-containing protein [Synechococcus sp. CBW1006]QPN66303.1 transposase [Synechococcus sp. CBW1006]